MLQAVWRCLSTAGRLSSQFSLLCGLSPGVASPTAGRHTSKDTPLLKHQNRSKYAVPVHAAWRVHHGRQAVHHRTQKTPATVASPGGAPLIARRFW
ncbi:hypothetical protein DEO72_LG6g929 [Vigna unguiculata]|uniref:Uncharacterized protein n=1 Tax=Vigna unguiculata TaxID=3917 RepID=A0A4D6M5V8_VIGUN|nr:hypothetical protein DEO72_LG6g929 [Vigna unguiculata]